jgi:hypothetical protein
MAIPSPTSGPANFHPPADPGIELSKDARLIYKTGQASASLRTLASLDEKLGLPFWLTAFLYEHGISALLLMIPVFTVLVPLAGFLPMPYNWMMRRRIMRWYARLKSLERSLEKNLDTSVPGAKRKEIGRIDAAVGSIKVPVDFLDQFYDLRLHIDLIRRRLAEIQQQNGREQTFPGSS